MPSWRFRKNTGAKSQVSLRWRLLEAVSERSIEESLMAQLESEQDLEELRGSQDLTARQDFTE